MRVSKTRIFLLVILFPFMGRGQKYHRFGQVYLLKGLLNPASLAAEAPINIGLVHRYQWHGVEGAPRTSGLHGSFELNPDMAIGLNVQDDRIGVERRTSLQLAYTYKLALNKMDYLSFGVQIGMENMSLNYGEVLTSSASDPVFSQSYSGTTWNAGFGAYGKIKQWYVGFSIPEIRVLHPFSKFSGYFPDRWHFYVLSGYRKTFQNHWILEPIIQLNAAVHAPLHAEVILRGGTKRFTVHGGYSFESAMLTGFDVTINELFRTAYQLSFPVGGNPLAVTRGVSHELALVVGLPSLETKEGFERRKYLTRRNKWQRR
jgi:type IX secretion system PorP/SprF family membrane protein